MEGGYNNSEIIVKLRYNSLLSINEPSHNRRFQIRTGKSETTGEVVNYVNQFLSHIFLQCAHSKLLIHVLWVTNFIAEANAAYHIISGIETTRSVGSAEPPLFDSDSTF